MKSFIAGIAALCLSITFYSFTHDYNMNRHFLNELRFVCEEASVAGSLFIDTVEYSNGKIVFNKVESTKAIEEVIKEHLNLDDNFIPLHNSYWTEKVTYKAYFYDDNNCTYPYLFTDDITGFAYVIRNPTVIVTINAGKARYSLLSIRSNSDNIRIAAHTWEGR